MIKRICTCMFIMCLIFLVTVSSAFAADTATGQDSTSTQEMPAGRGGRGGMGRQRPGGGMPSDFGGMTPPEGMTPPDMSATDGNMQQESPTPPDTANGSENEAAAPDSQPTENQFPERGPSGGFGGEFGGRGFGGQMGGAMSEQTQNKDESVETDENTAEASMTAMEFIKAYQTPIISMIVFAAAFVFVKLYKRKIY